MVLLFILCSSTAWAQSEKSAYVKELPSSDRPIRVIGIGENDNPNFSGSFTGDTTVGAMKENGEPRGPFSHQSSAGSPISSLPPDSDRWALVIGISKYEDGALNPLYGANDARRIAEDLNTYAGFRKDQIILLTDDQPADRQPRRERILFWLSSLKQNATQSGLLLIAFSGHGIESGNKTFLMPIDAHLNFDPIYLTRNAIMVDDFTESLRDSPAKQVIVLMDACRSNPFRTAGDTPNYLTPAFAKSFDYSQINLGKEAFVTIFATRLGGEAYQYESQHMGYFSWAFDQAIRGAAYDTKGQLTLSGLIDYLQTKVPPLVRLNSPGRVQTPYAIIGGYLADRVVLANNPKPSLRYESPIVTVPANQAPDPDAGGAGPKHGGTKAIVTVPANQASPPDTGGAGPKHGGTKVIDWEQALLAHNTMTRIQPFELNNPRFTATFWITGQQEVLDQIKEVDYYFDDPSFRPPNKKGTNAEQFFRISYTATGCIPIVRITIIPKDQSLRSGSFDFPFCAEQNK